MRNTATVRWAIVLLLAGLAGGIAHGFDRTWTEPTGELTCRAWSLRPSRTAIQHRAMFCVSASTGVLIGAGFRRDGSVKCAISGRLVDGCIFFRGCGYDEVTCG